MWESMIKDKDKKKKKEETISFKELSKMGYEERVKEKRRIETKSEKTLKSRRVGRAIRLGLLVILLFLVVIYIILTIFFMKGAFIISLDQNFAKKAGIVIYEDSKTRESKRMLKFNNLDFMDNIAEEWINKDVHNEGDGSHNGENYLAYTFYIENMGSDIINYWYSVVIDEVIKNVDGAIRVKIYLNDDEPKTFAKLANTGLPEPRTTPFYSDKYVCVEPRKNFKPGERDKMTIVVWLEGPDPDCIDPIVGGQMKMHMEITEEHKATTKDIVPDWVLKKDKLE